MNKNMNKKKRRILMNAFITSQLSYCPLAWMSHSSTMNNRINKNHEKAFRLVYKDETNLSLNDLLKKRQITKYSKNKSTNLSNRNL